MATKKINAMMNRTSYSEPSSNTLQSLNILLIVVP